MNQINLHNYEAFLLDYSEQKLSAVEVAELLLFVELHPELNIDIDDIDLAYLETESESYQDKSFLKEFPAIETLIIGKTENILSNDEEIALKNYLVKYPQTQKLITDYAHTILPVEHLSFPGKGQLKKRQVIPLYWSLAAAACLIGLLFTLSTQDNPKAKYHQGGQELAIEKMELNNVSFLNIAGYTTPEVDTNMKTVPTAEKNESKSQVNLMAGNPTIKNNLPNQTKKDSVPAKLDKEIAPFKELPNDNIALNDSSEKLTQPHDELAIASPIKSNNPLTVSEFLKVKTKEIVLKEENPNTDKLNGNELIASLATGLNSKTKMEVAYDASESDDKKVTKIKLGKIEFYRSASK